MATVSIIYFSGSGHTTRLAEAIHQGAQAVPGTTAHLLGIKGDDIAKGRYQNAEVLEKLDASDAIIFGSPTYMGGPAAQFRPSPMRRASAGINRPGVTSWRQVLPFQAARVAISPARWSIFRRSRCSTEWSGSGWGNCRCSRTV